MTVTIPFEALFENTDLRELRTVGYAVGAMQIGTVPMHVVALRVTIEDDEISYVGDLSGGDDDVDAILKLMGDGAGMPHVHEFEGHTYLLGAMPYAI